MAASSLGGSYTNNHTCTYEALHLILREESIFCVITMTLSDIPRALAIIVKHWFKSMNS